MTGLDLIMYIFKHNLEEVKIIGSDNEGIKFETDKEDVDFAYLWLKDDYYQDVIFNHEGDLTYGREEHNKLVTLSQYLNSLCMEVDLNTEPEPLKMWYKMHPTIGISPYNYNIFGE